MIVDQETLKKFKLVICKNKFEEDIDDKEVLD
jgi:hypothetical protein